MLRDLVQNINLRCSNLGKTLPRTMTVGAIGRSTELWTKNKHYPDCTHRAVVQPIFQEKDPPKGGRIPISTHKEVLTRTRSVRLVPEREQRAPAL